MRGSTAADERAHAAAGLRRGLRTRTGGSGRELRLAPTALQQTIGARLDRLLGMVLRLLRADSGDALLSRRLLRDRGGRSSPLRLGGRGE
ncbi:hypothetical protein SMALB_3508 [Streptomyces malaysiensis]|uniref:Uncharacterized protein n=1 Tax=Streptomyces malaysiensis TaxID=92644 RepID=A0A7X6AX93_STRMQ|nr:hypothetical protein [Streptomyces malaysiensis]